VVAFAEVGYGSIAPGYENRQRWWYRFENGQYVGPQHVMAHPMLSVPEALHGAEGVSAELVVDEQAIRREADGTYTYLVTIWNKGPSYIYFRLDGGGFV
jgi:hypothetical protein